MKEEDVNRCQIQEWYPRFKLVSTRTFIHELPESFVQYLLDDSGPFLLPVSISNEDAFPNRIHNPEEEEDYQVSEGSGDEAEPLSPPSFPELELKIKESIETLGGAIFPKLNWSAPKDSAWISTSGTLRSSDSLIHDLCHAYDSCSDKTLSRPPNFFLALRKWYPSFQPEMEFRCFVRGQKLVGISQREDECVKVLDFNPWGAFTLPLLFTWEELEQKPREGDDLDCRIVESRCAVQPGLKTAVPYDYLDVSAGSGWDQFLRNAGEELQRQTKSPEAGA
ncbi:hypothetical protein ES332_D13G140200v1 [Gossypium tomentosum]|uniref:Cell division cycle protein 123 homolog n=1 Tax=Gossypium tomentosum TaxID=34277 RepID=A0A5D2HWM2_GOSTO|nr:hypothetical protein ES332_D13G140200v1 [Gossypium tomentosum]TYH34646.1 hypothetical protein ES332_D13G140200v1 [Gossypium tomentosum]